MQYFLKVSLILILFKTIYASKFHFQAFQNISKALEESNHEVSVISVNGSSDFIEFSVLKNFRDQNVPHSVVAFESLNSSEYKGINTSAVIVFDSVGNLKDFNNETFTCNKPKFNTLTTLKSDFFYPFQIFVFCPGLNKTILSSMKDNPPPKNSIMLRYEYFIVDEGDFIDLYTFVWYTPEKCDQMQMFLVNSFSKKTRKWDTNTFKIDKFANFYGCLLKFYFMEGFPNYVVPKIEDGNFNCIGYTCRAAEILGQALNYVYESSVQLVDSQNRDAFVKTVFDVRWLNIFLSTAEQSRTKASYFLFYSTNFDFRESLIAIPKGSELDSYAKIIRPFDGETWLWVAITFITAFTSIFIIQFTNATVRNFIFGLNISNPGLNVLRIFFGISQIRCSGRNFARFLSMSFILFCIVIRTAYQAKMFQFLQMELRNPTFDTVDQLIENDFTFFMKGNFRFFYSGTDIAKRYKINTLSRYL